MSPLKKLFSSSQQTTTDGEILPNNLKTLLIGLCDTEFEQLITTRMLPILYRAAIAITAVIVAYQIGSAFAVSWQRGLVWLFLAGPAMFLAIVIAIRVILEFVIGFFRLIFYLENMQDNVEGIASGLPRIVFWRSAGKSAGDQP